MGRTVEADELQTVLTKVDRQVSQFKGRMLKGKVGGGGEVRTRRLHHDESDNPPRAEQGQVVVRYSAGACSARLASSPPILVYLDN